MTPLNALQNLMTGQPSAGLFDLVPTPPLRKKLRQKTGSDGPFGNGHFSPFVRVGPKYPIDPAAWTEAYAGLGFEVPPNSRFGPFGLLFQGQNHLRTSPYGHLEAFLHPLADVEDLEGVKSLPWPNTSDQKLYVHLKDSVSSIHAKGLIAVGQMDCTVFEHTWYLRGMEQLFLDWIEGNPVGNWLLDWFTERSTKAVEAFVEAGVDIIFLGDDVGSQQSLLLSREMWQEHLRPRLRTVIAAAREGTKQPWIAYHSDGAIAPLVSDLIDCGVQILNPIQPECVDIEAFFAGFHDKLAFWGGIGTQTTMPFGSASDVKSAVEGLLCLAARHNVRFIPAPTHYLEPDVPVDNIIAFLRAVQDGPQRGTQTKVEAASSKNRPIEHTQVAKGNL